MGRKLLQHVRLIDPVAKVDQICHVWLDNGQIKAIFPKTEINLPTDADTTVIDASGMVLGTGLIDLYSHSGEPGNESRETIASLLRAAAAGGFTQVCILPDTDPAIDHPAVLMQILQTAAQEHLLHPDIILPRLRIWGAITANTGGEVMTELADLATHVVGFADGKPLSNLGMVRQFLEYVQPFHKPVGIWACDQHLCSNGIVREGVEAVKFGLPLVPVSAESAAIASLLEVIQNTQTPVHLMRVSTARGAELIADAKRKGLPITASTTWLHVLKSTDDLSTYNPNLRLEPPLGNNRDRAALRDAVREGIIDAIAVDHSPYTYEEKTVAFAEAPPGAIGLELALPLLWQNLVATGEFTALELWQALSSRPAQCIGSNITEIAVENHPDLTLFNPQHIWQITSKNLHSLSMNSSWYGEEITGKVVEILSCSS